MSTTPARTYRSTRRAAQAAQTRSDVLAAAMRCFESTGWTGTTLAAIAREAGVAVETVYAGFGSKKGLLRSAMEAGVVGDAEPVAFAERDESRRLGRGTVGERLAAGAELVADIHERTAGTWRAILDLAAGDAEAATWRDELEAGRLVDVRRSLGLITDRDGADVDDVAVEALFVLYGPETYTKLVHDLGWSRERYAGFLVGISARILGVDLDASGAR
jgi:AcrR family transcriptional regulator